MRNPHKRKSLSLRRAVRRYNSHGKAWERGKNYGRRRIRSRR